MIDYTCNSCGASFRRDRQESGCVRLCMQCQIAFGLVNLHDTPERNKIEQMRTLENIRRYGETFSAVLEQILTQPKPITYKGHRLCPWCASPGVLVNKQVTEFRYRIVCASPDCSAAPEVNWSATEADAWSVWDTRK